MKSGLTRARASSSITELLSLEDLFVLSACRPRDLFDNFDFARKGSAVCVCVSQLSVLISISSTFRDSRDPHQIIKNLSIPIFQKTGRNRKQKRNETHQVKGDDDEEEEYINSVPLVQIHSHHLVWAHLFPFTNNQNRRYTLRIHITVKHGDATSVVVFIFFSFFSTSVRLSKANPVPMSGNSPLPFFLVCR